MHFGKAFMEEIGKGNAQIDWQLSKSKGGIRFESIDYKFFLCTRYSWWSRIQCEKTCRRITDQRTHSSCFMHGRF